MQDCKDELYRLIVFCEKLKTLQNKKWHSQLNQATLRLNQQLSILHKKLDSKDKVIEASALQATRLNAIIGQLREQGQHDRSYLEELQRMNQLLSHEKQSIKQAAEKHRRAIQLVVNQKQQLMNKLKQKTQIYGRQSMHELNKQADEWDFDSMRQVQSSIEIRGFVNGGTVNQKESILLSAIDQNGINGHIAERDIKLSHLHLGQCPPIIQQQPSQGTISVSELEVTHQQVLPMVDLLSNRGLTEQLPLSTDCLRPSETILPLSLPSKVILHNFTTNQIDLYQMTGQSHLTVSKVRLSEFTVPKGCFSISSQDGRLFLIGKQLQNSHQQKYLSHVWCWQRDQGLSLYAKLLTPRKDMSCCIANQKIYVIGGFKGQSLRKCESISIQPQCGSEFRVNAISSLHKAAINPCISPFTLNYIFKVGDMLGTSIELYEVDSNQWKQLRLERGLLHYSRFSKAAMVQAGSLTNNTLIILGGQNYPKRKVKLRIDLGAQLVTVLADNYNKSTNDYGKLGSSQATVYQDRIYALCAEGNVLNWSLQQLLSNY